MGCLQNIQLMHQTLPIVIPFEFALLIFVASMAGYVIYQEITKALKQRSMIGREQQVNFTYNIVQDAQEIAMQAWIQTSDQQPDAISV